MEALAGVESTIKKRRRLEFVANDAYDSYCKAYQQYKEAKEMEITSGIENL